ncbi:MAG: type IA DNA topoisomerase [Lachnospiraceae bacterium]|nr:type IA DNA topoisomerase [Lachnospiraceae bacterium]
MKALFIAEKPSVAQEFARALKVNGPRRDGYIESDDYVVTWCVGHLVTMSYPEKYDIKYKKWNLENLPFLPEKFRYEIIPSVSKQFNTVSGLLSRDDVGTIYVCTDSGREGEYIYRLVEMMSPASVKNKDRRRVWIDSFTDEEISRGIREARPLEDYNNLSDSAYLRAKEDYLMGINFSRVLTLKYGSGITDYLGGKWKAVAVGRVMTCVLGMVVRREREIRSFVKTPFYRVIGVFGGIEAEWRAVPPSEYYIGGLSGQKTENNLSPLLYKENGFRKKEDAEALIAKLKQVDPCEGIIAGITRRREKKNPPMLYNLAELQNDCSRMFKISPDQTLQIAQELYEKKLTTYPRTDARVLSSAVAKEINRNLAGLTKLGSSAPGSPPSVGDFAAQVLAGETWKKIGSTRYTNDKAITDHYAIIPTGQGLQNLNSLSQTARRVYDTICRRFLAIFYPPAEYDKTAITIMLGRESFFANSKVLVKEGWLAVTGGDKSGQKTGKTSEDSGENTEIAPGVDITKLKKGAHLPVDSLTIKEGETSPPKRYTSGSIILAMENAGQLIEDESLREQIRGSGIGTSATRAEILKKLVTIEYLALNKKTQVITPELLGEMVYDTVNASIRPLLNAELTASWEKGLTGVAEGTITEEEYMEKLNGFVARRTNAVKGLRNQAELKKCYDYAAQFYKSTGRRSSRAGTNNSGGTSVRQKKAGSGNKKAE